MFRIHVGQLDVCLREPDLASNIYDEAVSYFTGESLEEPVKNIFIGVPTLELARPGTHRTGGTLGDLLQMV